MLWLGQAKQGSMTIERFNTLFRINGQKANFQFRDSTLMSPNPHQDTLKFMYARAIQPRLSSQIIIAGQPENINQWMTKAAEIDSAFRRTNSLFARGVQEKQKQPWKPRFSSTRTSPSQYGEPMDIDSLQVQKPQQGNPYFKQISPEEKTRRMEKGLCLQCGGEGHFAKGCRVQGKLTEPQQHQTAKGKQPKPKFNPTQLRHHIRSLISETFEEESPDYLAFIQEVEEQGF